MVDNSYNSKYEVCGYRSDMSDIQMYEKYCQNFNPISFNDWYRFTLDYMNRKTDKTPYIGLWVEAGIIQ